MTMKISGFQKNSFIDYPGRIASVLFVPGCNMNCYFCHNRHLLKEDAGTIDIEEVLKFLESRKGFIDAVVFSGGEPTIYPDIGDLMKKMKDMGYLIKLDTNGMRPEVTEILIKKGFLSYIAVDIKAPYDKYDMISDKICSIDGLKKTVDLLIGSGLDYEFRTTFLPSLVIEDIVSIAKEIQGAKNFYIQQFRALSGQEGIIDFRAGMRPHSKEYVMAAAGEAKKALITTNVAVRGVK